MKRLPVILALASLLAFATTIALWSGMIGGMWMIRQGDGGLGRGTVATIALFSRKHSIGIGWTYSDIWFDHQLSLPHWLAVSATAILLLLSITYLLKTLRTRDRGFPVQPTNTRPL